MAITHKQSLQNHNAGGTTITLAVTPTALGNLLVVLGGNDATTGTISIADTAGNIWTVANPLRSQTGGGQAQSWFALANGTSATTITITGSVSGFFMNVLLDEFDGNDRIAPLVEHDENNGATGNAISKTLVLGADDTVVWSGCNDSVTAVGNIDGSAATKGADDTVNDWTQYRILTGRKGASLTSAFTGSGTWIILTAAFRPVQVVVPQTQIFPRRVSRQQRLDD